MPTSPCSPPSAPPPIVNRYLTVDIRRGDAWFALLNEQLHRYPLDDRQVIPTRLGNAIRQFEEYGYDRYRLDSQVLWHELNAAVPDMRASRPTKPG